MHEFTEVQHRLRFETLDPSALLIEQLNRTRSERAMIEKRNVAAEQKITARNHGLSLVSDDHLHRSISYTFHRCCVLGSYRLVRCGDDAIFRDAQ